MKFDRTNFLSSQNFRILFLKLIQPHYCLNNVISTKTFTTLSQQILSGRLLLVIMSRQKSNLNCKFTLEPITTYHIKALITIFFVK